MNECTHKQIKEIMSNQLENTRENIHLNDN